MCLLFILSGPMVLLYASCLLLLSLVLIKQILRCSLLILLIRRGFSANCSSMVLLCGILSLLQLKLLLLSCLLFLMHLCLVTGNFFLEFIEVSFYLHLEVFHRLFVVVKEVKVLYQKLTTSSCFLLLLFKEFLGSFIILLCLIIIVDIICILLKTHIIVPILIYNVDH